MAADLRVALNELAHLVPPVTSAPTPMLKRVRLRRATFITKSLFASGAIVAMAVFWGGAIVRTKTAAPATRPVITTTISLGMQPGGIEAVGDAVWLSFCNKLLRIDPHHNAIESTIEIGGCHTLTAGFGSLWISTLHPEPGLLRLDPTTGKQKGFVSLPVGTTAPVFCAAGEGSVWCVVDHQEIYRVDPGSVQQALVGKYPEIGAIAVGLGSIWALGGEAVMRIDPASGDIIASLPLDIPNHSSPPSGALFVARGQVWIAGDSDRFEVERFDIRKKRKDLRIALPGSDPATSILFADDALWLGRPSELVRVDLRSNDITHRLPIRHDDIVWGLASAKGSVWALLFRSETLIRVDLVSRKQQ